MDDGMILHRNAFENIHAYSANISYWSKLIHRIMKHIPAKGYDYIPVRKSHNQEGYPIYRCINQRKHKGVYIYQYPPNEYSSSYEYKQYITAWEKEIDKNRILIICLLCTRENVENAVRLMTLWMNDEDVILEKEIEYIYNSHESRNL